LSSLTQIWASPSKDKSSNHSLLVIDEHEAVKPEVSVIMMRAEPQRRKKMKPKRQQSPQPAGACSHPTRQLNQLQLSFINVNTSQKERLDSRKHGATQQQTSVIKSVVKNPCDNKFHNLAILLITSQQTNQLQLSFINVSSKPEGEIGRQQTWVNTTADRYKSVVNNPSDNKILSLALVLTARQQPPDPLQQSFINVNTKRQQNPQPGASCFHHTLSTKSTSAKLHKCTHTARRRWNASKFGSTQ
jgi:hypothetical protein